MLKIPILNSFTVHEPDMLSSIVWLTVESDLGPSNFRMAWSTSYLYSRCSLFFSGEKKNSNEHKYKRKCRFIEANISEIDGYYI